MRLNSPLPFHSPLMEPVKAEFQRRLQRYSARPLEAPVYSPILGRYYQPSDRVTDCLADHLVRPVRFAHAVGELRREGVGILIECGALDALTKLSKRAAPDADFLAIACLTGDSDEVGSLKRAAATLSTLGKTRGSALPAEIWPGTLAGADTDRFFAERAAAIRQFVEQEYARFRQDETRAEASTTVPVAPAVARPQTATAPVASHVQRAEVWRDLVTMYAAALEYPEEVFTEAVELEAELGIDSVKQTELLARVSDKYGLPPRPADFKLADYNTLGKVVDFVCAARSGGTHETAPIATPGPSPVTSPAAPVDGPPKSTREQMFARIVSLYAAALEYPEEVFTPDVALEAELGIDSVKQTELLARVSETFGLPDRPADFRLANYDTLGKVTDFVFDTIHLEKARS